MNKEFELEKNKTCPQSPGLCDFVDEFCQMFQEGSTNLTEILSKLRRRLNTAQVFP